MAIKIYIDQGHNPRSYNTGAEGNGYFEQDITYRIGILLSGYFSQNTSFEVRLSRPTADTILGTSNSTSLSERVRDANRWGADLFLSLHTNASVSSAANGMECLVYDYSAAVANAVAEDILEQTTLITGVRNRGIVERPGLYVLRRTEMPAVVVEMGFITNASDAELMVNSPNLFALGIYRGVLQYYGLL
ncbi:MAG: N-acetylmuramoyl-L-alanine amidase [Ruminococcaceae bacterium]|nr:N-acetylmuramoyl-L-alanine amidase [Oscillospiraceae bacterium]